MRTRRIVFLGCLVGCLGLAGPLQAAGTRVLVENGTQFAKGELKSLALDSSRQLVPAPLQAEQYSSDALYVWSLAFDSGGRLLAGSGDSGVIYRLEKDELVTWSRTLAFEILSLLPFDGEVLAGTSPDGIVYRVSDSGGVDVALDLPQQSIWALAPGSDDGSWIAGGGPAARIVRVSGDAPAGELIASFPATNVVCLLRDESGLWVGTQGPGLLYRIEGGDRETPRVVFESPEDEIRAIVADGDEGVYVLSLDAGLDGTSGKSRITWLGKSGGQEEIFESTGRFLSMARLPDGSLLAGEGTKGLVHRIELSGSSAVWAELDGADPLALMGAEDGEFFVGTGNLGGVFRLKPGRESEGTYTSEVLEAKHVETWGRLSIEADGENVRFATRSGFRRSPDETWSEWSSDGRVGGVINSPVAPYLQYRLTIPGGKKPTHVNAVRVAYRERNLPPRVQSVTVEPAGGMFAAGSVNSAPQLVSQRFEDGLSVEYSVNQPRAATPPENAAWARGLRTLRWLADDPNEDLLRYAVEVRREPKGDWYTLAEDLNAPVLAWDTRAFDDGRYRIRVRVHDGPSNSQSARRNGEGTSGVVHVDNRPPIIENVKWEDADGKFFGARVRDEQSPLAEVSMRMGEGSWAPLDPVDGVLDDRQEDFNVPRPTNVPPGQQVWLRATDAAGNVAMKDLGPAPRVTP